MNKNENSINGEGIFWGEGHSEIINHTFVLHDLLKLTAVKKLITVFFLFGYGICAGQNIL